MNSNIGWTLCLETVMMKCVVQKKTRKNLETK